VTGDQAAALEALGYLASTVELSPDAADPRDRIDFVTALQAAEAAPAADAIPILEGLVAQAPMLVDVQLSLALKRVEAGDLEGGLRETERLLEQTPDHTLALANAAFLSRALKRPAETLQYAERLRRLNPMDPRGYRLAAAVYVDEDNAEQVLEVARAGVGVAPDDPNLNYLLGLAEVQAGDPLVGVEALRTAREAGSRAGDLDLWIGAGLQRGGKVDEARDAYDAATRSMLGDPRPFAMAGWMLYKADRCKDARGYLVNAAKRAGTADDRMREALAACGR
jgi:tetratricopeptide (TPR) repeat protein